MRKKSKSVTKKKSESNPSKTSPKKIKKKEKITVHKIREEKKNISFGNQEQLIVQNIISKSSEKIVTSQEVEENQIIEILKNVEIFRTNSLKDVKTELKNDQEKVNYLIYQIAKFSLNTNENLLNVWLESKIKSIPKNRKNRLTLTIPKNRRKTDLVIAMSDIPEISLEDTDYKDIDFYHLSNQNEEEIFTVEKIKTIRKSFSKLNNIKNNNNNNNNKRVSEVFSLLDKIKKDDFLVENLRFFKMKNLIKKVFKVEYDQKDLKTIEIGKTKLKKKISFQKMKTSFLKFPILQKSTNESSPFFNFYEDDSTHRNKKSESQKIVLKNFAGNDSESKLQAEEKFVFKRKNENKIKSAFEEQKDPDNSDDSFIRIKNVDYLNRQIMIKEFGRYNHSKACQIGKNLGSRD